MKNTSPGRAFKGLETEIMACAACVPALGHAPRPVVRLSATAPILIAGQAPGTRVHASGLPFDDPSGDRLRAWLGVDRVRFYDRNSFAMLPMGFCFPGLDAHGGDLPPRRECAPLWRARALAVMPQIQLILAIGAYAQRWHMGNAWRGGVGDTVRAFRDTGPGLIPLPHPSWRNSAWLKRNPWFETELLPHLRQRIRDLLGD